LKTFFEQRDEMLEQILLKVQELSHMAEIIAGFKLRRMANPHLSS
jgi:hypothetical protein